MNLDMRYEAGQFRLGDFVVRVLVFDRRECGPNSSLSYVAATTPRGKHLLAADERTPRTRAAKLVREITSAGRWFFLPFCVFGDDVVRCADGAKIARRAPHDRSDGGWPARARTGDCAGFIVGLEHDRIVLRPAFNPWARGGDCAIVVADDLGGLERPLQAFAGSYAQGAAPP